MLMPKKVKYRKQQRGRMCGKAWRGGELSFGELQVESLSPTAAVVPPAPSPRRTSTACVSAM
jgi:hypothetical protein